jgi:hypothetical protein
LVPQLGAPWSRHWPAGSAPPAAIGVHMPALPASAHDTHEPVQAVLQQAPCAQVPLTHSVPSPQMAPSGLRPQDPPLHEPGGAQSASAVQVDLHAAVPQRKGKQVFAAGVTHVPAPSQLEAGVSVAVPIGQFAAWHGVPWA